MNSIPFGEASAFFYGLKQAAEGDAVQVIAAGDYAVPPEQVLQLMGEMLENELKTMYAYKVYAQTLRDFSQPAIADEFDDHGDQELGHAEWLMKRMSVIADGGIHCPDIPAPPAASDPAAIVQVMKGMEATGLELWKSLHALMGENPSKYEIEAMMVVEQSHADELSQMTPRPSLGAALTSAPASAPSAAPTAKTKLASVLANNENSSSFKPALLNSLAPQGEQNMSRKDLLGPKTRAAVRSGPAEATNMFRMANKSTLHEKKASLSSLLFGKTAEEVMPAVPPEQMDPAAMEAAGQVAELQAQSTYLADQANEASMQAQQAQQQMEQMGQQLEQAQQESQMAQQQIQETQQAAQMQVQEAHTALGDQTQAALAAESKALLNQQLAAKMRAGMQQQRQSLMDLASQDFNPEAEAELGIGSGGIPSPNGMMGGADPAADPAAAAAAQGMDPAAAQAGADPAAAPAEGAEQAPPAEAKPAEKKEESKKSDDGKGTTVKVETKEAGALTQHLIDHAVRAAPGAVIGGALNAAPTIHRSMTGKSGDHAQSLRDKLKLTDGKELGLLGTIGRTNTKADLVMADLEKEKPALAAVMKGLSGAAIGGGISGALLGHSSGPNGEAVKRIDFGKLKSMLAS